MKKLHPKTIDISGQTFGRWYVLKHSPTRIHQGAVYYCQCLCGTKREVRANSLKTGKSQSCGCLQKEAVSLARARYKEMRRLQVEEKGEA